MADIQSILDRYISGEATPHEAELVELWMKKLPENHDEFEKQWKTREIAGRNGNYAVPDIAKEWSGMQDKFMQLNKIRPKPNLAFRLLAYSTTALLVITAILVFLFSSRGHLPTPVIVHSSTDSILSYSLPGGGSVILDRHSSISYPEKGTGENLVTIKGAVYLKNINSQKESLVVKAGPLEIVPGKADIFISFDTTRRVATVHVQSGTAVLRENNERLTIHSGESAEFNENAGNIEKKPATNINLYSYATRVFDFTDMPLKEACGYLEKAYHTVIIFQEPGMGNCRITTRFDNKTLKEILDIMALTLNFQYKNKPDSNQVLISGKGCE